MLPDKKKTKIEEISPYYVFAEHYDRFMEHVPYQVWAAYLWQRVGQLRGELPRNLLDLGCGTAQIMAYLLAHQIPMVGVDHSTRMLAHARGLVPQARFVQAELSGPLPLETASFDWLISTHDCLNYLIDREQLAQHFKEVARVMRPKGLYSADFVSLDNIRRHFAGRTRVHRLGPLRLVWSNRYDAQQQILVSRLDFKDKAGRVHREEHRQRYYDRTTVQQIAAEHGLETVLLEADYRRGPPRPEVSFYNFHFRKVDR